MILYACVYLWWELLFIFRMVLWIFCVLLILSWSRLLSLKLLLQITQWKTDDNICRYATKTEHTICMGSRLMRTQDGFMEFLCVIDFIMKSISWPLVTLSDNTDEDVSYRATLKSLRLKHPINPVACHLNINSIRRKFIEVSELCSWNIVDILFLSETKLDASFPIAWFHISGFKCHRADRNCNGGGIMVYIRSDIAHRRRNDMENAVTSPSNHS